MEELPEAHLFELPLTSRPQQTATSSTVNSKTTLPDDATASGTDAFETAYASAGTENEPEKAVATDDGSSGNDTDKNTEATEPEAELVTSATEPGTPKETAEVETAEGVPGTEPEAPEFAASEAPRKLSTADTKAGANDENFTRSAAQISAPVSGMNKQGLPEVPETPAEPNREKGSLPVQASGSTVEHLVRGNAKGRESIADLQVTKKGETAQPPQENISEFRKSIPSAGRKPGTSAQSGLEPMQTTFREKPSSLARMAETSRFAGEPLAAGQMAPAPKTKPDAPLLVARTGFQHIQRDAIDDRIPPILIEGGDMEGVIQLEQRAPGQIASANIGHILGRAEAPTMIARQMAEAFQNLSDRPVEISLNPRELGRVRMNIVTVDAGITVNVVAERPETLDLMRRNIEQLVREFEAMGYNDINFAFAEGETRQRFENESTEHDDQAQTKLNLETVEETGLPREKAARSSGVDIRL